MDKANKNTAIAPDCFSVQLTFFTPPKKNTYPSAKPLNIGVSRP